MKCLDGSVKTRYTPLETGSIPSSWNKYNIKSLTDKLTNGFVGTCLPYQTSEIDGVKYLQGWNIRENKIEFNKLTKVTKKFHDSNEKSQLKPGDLLVVQSGHIGTVAVVPHEIGEANCHALIIVRFKK